MKNVQNITFSFKLSKSPLKMCIIMYFTDDFSSYIMLPCLSLPWNFFPSFFNYFPHCTPSSPPNDPNNPSPPNPPYPPYPPNPPNPPKVIQKNKIEFKKLIY